jgi:hypothetical protein
LVVDRRIYEAAETNLFWIPVVFRARLIIMACGVCGCVAVAPAIYMARRDGDREMVTLPALECQRCGAVQPDAVKIGALDRHEIPASVRLRYAKVLGYE